MHSIILSDPKFALSQLKAARQQKTQTHRLLASSDAPQLESLPFNDDTLSFGDPSSVRKFTLSSRQGDLMFLGSCNGLVFLTFHSKFFYIWNPSTCFFRKLPDPGFSVLHGNLAVVYRGVGYVSATDDYKLFITYLDHDDNNKIKVEIFSLKSHEWEKIEVPGESIDYRFILTSQGILLNETLHWLNEQIVCFDLAVKEFRRMPLPDFGRDGKNCCSLGLYEGCLCVLRFPYHVCDSVDFWVMREYGVSDSWILPFSSILSDPPHWGIFVWLYDSKALITVDSCTVASKTIEEGFELSKTDHRVGQNVGRYMLEGKRMSMVEYEESLVGISGDHPVEDAEEVHILETYNKASRTKPKWKECLLFVFK